MINKYYLDDDTYLNLSCDLAHKFMEGILKSEIKNYITPNPKDGEQYYTDEGEKIFQKCLADVESVLKLTYHEMQDIAWSAEQLEGSTYEDEDGKATFEGTEYGDDAQYQMEEGEEDLAD